MSHTATSPPDATPQPRGRVRIGWPGAGTAIVAAGLAWGLHLGLGLASGASLHVDEAQYWDWSRALQWGYYSKPPGIAALIAVSTALFGDSEVGVRALPTLCLPLSALVLSALAADVATADHRLRQDAPDAGAPARAGIWAAILWLACPLAGLLGMVATTDGPLLLCWSLALAGLWWAGVRQRPQAWGLVALACGAGLQTKYTMAAFLAGAVLWLVVVAATGADRATRLARLLIPGAVALLLAVLLWLPNLVWNHAAGWPTWRHTAEITIAAPPLHAGASMPSQLLAGLLALVGYTLVQTAVLGPLVLPLCAWMAWRCRQPVAVTPGPGASVAAAPPHQQALRRLLLWTSLPLALAGAWQAARGSAQSNWVAPLHLAASLVLAQPLADARAGWQRRAAAAVALQVVAVTCLVVGPALATRAGWNWPARLDPWARMRGWPEAITAMGPALQAHPGAVLVGTSRTLVAQAGYHLRTLAPQRAAWAHDDPTPRHHYAQACPWHPRRSRDEVLLLSEGRPPDAGTGLAWQTLVRAPLRERDGQAVVLWLSLARPVDASAPAPLPTKLATCR